MDKYNKLRVEYSATLGYFLGIIEGLEWWDIPPELKQKLSKTKSELQKKIIDFDNEYNGTNCT